MKKIIRSYWGDVVCGILFIITGFVFFRVGIGYNVNKPLALVTLILSVVFILVAYFELIRLRKRAFRDWIYPVFGILFSIIMYFYLQATIPGNLFWATARAADFVIITMFFLFITLIVRGALRLAKRI